MKLLVIIPTYNEIENISKIVPAVFDVIPENAGLLVVDDGSPDGTGNAVKEMQKHYDKRLFLLERKEKSGLANAYIAGFNWGLDAGYDVFCEMDADFSHKPEYLPVLYKEIQTYDVAIGSRNIKGGWRRRLVCTTKFHIKRRLLIFQTYTWLPCKRLDRRL